MTDLLPVLVSGIAFGMLYALMGTGLVLIYRGSRVINFAYGSSIGLLAYIAHSLLSSPLPMLATFPLAIIAAVVLGYVSRFLVVTVQDRVGRQAIRARGLFDEDTLLRMVVSTIGLSLVIQGAQPLIWGSQTLRLPLQLPRGNLTIGDVGLPWESLTIIAVAGFSIGAIGLFLTITAVGFNIRALFSNSYASNLLGLAVSRSFTIVWIIGMLAGLIAAVLASSVIFITPTSYIGFAFTAFIAIVLGGLESLRGAVVGGLILGIGTSLVNYYVPVEIDQLLLLAAAVAVLIVRPQGLFSASTADVGRL